MWHCGVNPLTNEPIYVAKTAREKRLQRALFFFRDPDYWPDVREALRECNRAELIGHGPECLVPHETRRERLAGKGGGGAHYPGKAPPHLRKRQKDNNDGWGPRESREPKRKRYEEDHGMPSGGPGCGSGVKVPAAASAQEDHHPRGEGGALEWMS